MDVSKSTANSSHRFAISRNTSVSAGELASHADFRNAAAFTLQALALLNVNISLAFSIIAQFSRLNFQKNYNTFHIPEMAISDYLIRNGLSTKYLLR